MTPLDDRIRPRPSAARPLQGLTLLLVEDSRYAAEGMRLLCQRSGARLRRADTLHAARRHLCVYRPAVAIIDLGLPDGSGTELIADLARATPRIDAILGTSADPGAEAAALAAGADGFLAKPLTSLAQFQSLVLAALPPAFAPSGPRGLADSEVRPDRIALHDDLSAAAEALADGRDAHRLPWLTQFLGSVARSTGDEPLTVAVDSLAAARSSGRPFMPDMARVAALVQNRLSGQGPV